MQATCRDSKVWLPSSMHLYAGALAAASVPPAVLAPAFTRSGDAGLSVNVSAGTGSQSASNSTSNFFSATFSPANVHRGASVGNVLNPPLLCCNLQYWQNIN